MSGLLFHNALVVTMDPARSRAEVVAVAGGRIVAAGSAAETARALDGDAQRIDCAGGLLLPAFIDAHCHLLAYAASLRSADCTRARSIAEIQESVRRQVAKTPAGRWVRAFGYEETALVERRHPTRDDLDAAVPDYPVRLIHRGGHASVLNSVALRLADIGVASEEPSGGVIERDLSSGEPNGVLLGMERQIDRVAPPLAYEDLRAAVVEASHGLLRAGVGCVQDATYTNGRSEWELFERLFADGALPLDVVLLEGLERMGELPEQSAHGRLRRGAVKIMVEELGDTIAPDEAELARRVAEVHTSARQLAVHAVGERAVLAAANAIDEALRRTPRDGHRHRIEHCSLLPDGLAPRLSSLGVTVVSQPSFVYERGERYLQLVPAEEQGRLHAFRTLSQAGVRLAAGSDAPVATPAPLASVAAAVERRTAEGRDLAPGQAVSVSEALLWWTAGAAEAGFLEDELGALRRGLRADLVLLPAGALEASPAELRALAVRRLWRRGREVEL